MCDMVKKIANARNCSLVIHKAVENVCQGVGNISHLDIILRRDVKKVIHDGDLQRIKRIFSQEGRQVLVHEVISIFGFIDKC